MTDSLADLGLVLQQLRRDLDRELAVLDAPPVLRDVDATRVLLDRLLADLDAQLERHSNAAVITLVGATGAGKSTLLNALVGAEIAIAGTTRPTTTKPVLYRPKGADTRALIDELGGPDAVTVVDSDHGLFREHILIDAPDTNSYAREHHRTVARLAERSDVLIVVAHRQSVAEMMSVEFIDQFAKRRHLCFVLNRRDELDDAATQTVLNQLSEFAEGRWNQNQAVVVATSAKNALAGHPDDGFRTLSRHLESLVEDGALGRIRRDNALGLCSTLATWAEALRERLAERSRATDPAESDAFVCLLHSTKTHLTELLTQLKEELARRLELQARDIELLLWNECARRWQGPGGLALRAGGLTGIGLGAGAMVARRSPWIAAGAAAGSMLVDRAQSGLRERRIESGHGLVPTHHEIASWYRTTMSAPRLLAQDLTGNPEAFHLPTADQVADQAHGAIESVWSRFLQRDLAEAGARGASFWQRLCVDGPVYLVLGWIVLQALAGVLPAAWLDALPGVLHVDALTTDRLINSGIVLFAWLLIARGLVRWRLRGIARRLTGRVAEHAQNEFDQLTHTLPEALQRELAEREAALEHLVQLDDLWQSRLQANPTTRT